MSTTRSIVVSTLRSRSVSRIDTGDDGYNGSIARFDDRYILFYRTGGILYGTDRRIRICFLDPSFKLIGDSQVFCQGRHQDPRVLEIDDGYVMATSDESHLHSWRFRRAGETFTYSGPVALEVDGLGMSEVERNWTIFEKDGRIRYLYTIDPSVVLEEKGSGCRVVARTKPLIDWPIGFMSGGSPAVPYNAHEYITFFHSFVSSNRKEYLDRRYYFNGILCFSREVPHRITRISCGPVDYSGVPDPDNPRCPHKVLFPAGLIVDVDRVVVSLGVNDMANVVVELDREEIDKVLVPVELDASGAGEES